jgi:hypothetical protein
MKRVRIYVWALLLVSALALEASEPKTNFEAALLSAAVDPAVEFSLEVRCTDRKGPRLMTLYPSGVMIWNGRRQARLDEQHRKGLARALVDAGFAGFEHHYGGKPAVLKTGAPLSILCSIGVTAAGEEKYSYQDLNGERSSVFMSLASTLLDQVEKPGEMGVSAESLADGLDKLSDGRLAPEAFEMLLLRLSDQNPKSGVIMEAKGGRLSRQPYRPGDEIGEKQTRALTQAWVIEAIDAVRAADLLSMPSAMPANNRYRLELSVLENRVSVQARPSSFDFSADTVRAGQRLESLAETLLKIN